MQSSSDEAIPAQFPDFLGDVHTRPPRYKQVITNDVDLTDYTIHAYQYATSSRPGFGTPAAIIYPSNDSDILSAIQYANDANISIAVRSGGHQFWGYSSTSGQNIQIDMSNYKKRQWNEEDETITVGVGCYLWEVDEALREYDAFLPHGMCGTVCVGGHLHTGGFSVLCGRSFGFFGDFVTSFTIITADLEVRRYTKPVEGAEPNPENDDLWFSLIGGSPGNFGVVTEVTLKPFFDVNYPEARSMTLYLPYSKTALQNILDITADYTDRDDLPADFNVTCWTFGNSKIFLRKNIDTKMMKEHPEIYGGTPAPHPYVLAIWATWCNLDGQDYTQQAQDFFTDIKARVDAHESLFDRTVMNALLWISEKNEKFETIPSITPDEPIKMSHLSKLLSFNDRVHSNPHVSASWCGNQPDHRTNGFVEWATDITDEVHQEDGTYADFGWVMSGGKHSKYRTNYNATSIPWRDTTIFVLQYIHYDFTTQLGGDWEAPGDFSREWVEKVHQGAIGEGGCLASADRQWNAFPNTFQGDSLDDNWKSFFETEEDYLRVLNTKLEIDPGHIFTPNLFCVGAKEHFKRKEE